jgi:NAD(P)-dependent dehydrogenase (short-subunit alcohol dehydrogenase family)
LARNPEHLDQLKREVKGVQTLVGDVSDPNVAVKAINEIKPDILVLNAGAIPSLGPIQTLTWEQFERPWETDVKQTFNFGKEALCAPLAPGSTVIIMSSGAALSGSPLSGGYAGSKRTQWMMTQYLQQQSDALKLGIRFITLIPKQIMDETELGRAAVATYSAAAGLTEQEYMSRWNPRLTPEKLGHAVIALVTDSAYQPGMAYGASGDGMTEMN